MNNIQALKEFLLLLFDSAQQGKMGGCSIPIGELTKEGKVYLSSISGLTFKKQTDFVINMSDLRHIYNRHYGNNEKDKGNNIPLTKQDIANMVDIIASPEKIIFLGKNKADGVSRFAFLKRIETATYSLLEVYGNAGGRLGIKTFYKTKKGISQRAIEISKSLQLSTSETAGASLFSEARLPNMLAPVLLVDKVSTFASNKQEKAEKKTVKAVPSAALKQAIDSIKMTQPNKHQTNSMKKTLTIALLLSSAICGTAQTHFPKNYNVDLGGGVNDAGNYTPVVAAGYTFNNWFALYGRYSFATDKIEDGRLTYWEHTGEVYPSFTVRARGEQFAAKGV